MFPFRASGIALSPLSLSVRGRRARPYEARRYVPAPLLFCIRKWPLQWLDRMSYNYTRALNLNRQRRQYLLATVTRITIMANGAVNHLFREINEKSTEPRRAAGSRGSGRSILLHERGSCRTMDFSGFIARERPSKIKGRDQGSLTEF